MPSPASSQHGAHAINICTVRAVALTDIEQLSLASFPLRERAPCERSCLQRMLMRTAEHDVFALQHAPENFLEHAATPLFEAKTGAAITQHIRQGCADVWSTPEWRAFPDPCCPHAVSRQLYLHACLVSHPHAFLVAVVAFKLVPAITLFLSTDHFIVCIPDAAHR